MRRLPGAEEGWPLEADSPRTRQTFHVCDHVSPQHGALRVWGIKLFLFSSEYRSVPPRGEGMNYKLTELFQWRRRGGKLGACPQGQTALSLGTFSPSLGDVQIPGSAFHCELVLNGDI